MHRQSLASPAASPGSGRAGALLSGLLWLLLGITCASAEERPPLRVMTDYWPPFRMEGEGGALHGLDIDLLNEIARRTGLRFDVQRAPWARGLAALQSGSADLMTGLARTPERERYIDYLPTPYYACAPRLYGTPELARRITRYEQLRGPTIGYVLESAYFQPFDSDAGLHKSGVSNEQQLLEMLLRGRLQLVIGTDCQVDYELRDPRLAGRIVRTGYQPDTRTELFIGFTQQQSLAEEKDRIASALQQMLDEGWVKEAARRYQPGSQ
ncbi:MULTISPECIES: substrate-binding periplasmic protein [unclassified Pseudomonas]|uniref:substrate-binding periplasmic protein n=1 Tax=unclassified Pseudomonas TaxID=196821 RepID=UPI001BCC5A06|nr:transporter substrate-binding domain-containing protein [Pseudomonas sp. Pc102]BBP81283.1 ABC transporter substrate-binding protein [Pseudomonas sp. Pc102]